MSLSIKVRCNMSETYLIHHGIIGQKWGDKNGPPYPLDASDHSSAEKKAGKKGWTKEAKAVQKGNNEKILEKKLAKQIRRSFNNRKNNINDIKNMQKKLHDSKPKKENEFTNKEYLLASEKATKGKVYIKQLKKEILDGYVTSFVEDSKGNTDVHGKTLKGVVIRDKEGNRVTAYDYNTAQSMIYKYRHSYIGTGAW